MSLVLSPYFNQLESRPAICWRGRVTQVVGNLLESVGPPCSLGECCEVRDAGGIYWGEVVRFRGTTVLTMPLEKPSGVRYGDPIVAHGERPFVAVGEELLGRVIDGSGCALDGRPAHGAAPAPPAGYLASLALERLPDSRAAGLRHSGHRRLFDLRTGATPGHLWRQRVGKSTLIGMMARGTSADLTVLALVGERGREVGEFLEALGSRPAPLGRRGFDLRPVASSAHSRRPGRHQHCRVLLPDRERRVAGGRFADPLRHGSARDRPGRRRTAHRQGVYALGFSMLARLVERAGRFPTGSITAFYTVLMEGDDQQDPLVDALRSLLDGHICSTVAWHRRATILRSRCWTA